MITVHIYGDTLQFLSLRRTTFGSPEVTPSRSVSLNPRNPPADKHAD